MRSSHLTPLASAAAGTIAALGLMLAIIGIASSASAAVNGPTVVLSSANATTTNAASIAVTATFSEAVGGFASTSVNVSNGTITNVSGSGTSYTFDVNPSSEGSVSVSIPADTVTSVASSTGNQASNTLTFTSDTIAPVIAQVTGVAATTTDATPSFAFSSTEAGTLALGGGCSSATTDAAAGTTTITFNTLAVGPHACTLSLSDAAGNQSNTLNIDFAEAVPAAAPVISNIAVSNIGNNAATITWNTDVAATGMVSYGSTASYGSSSTAETTASTTHSATLTSLSEGSVYHFKVTESDTAGTATSSDMTFVTSSTASSTPLAFNGADAVNANAIADNTYADGWQWTLHFTVPDNENAFRVKFNDFSMTNGSGTVPIAGNVRVFSSQSSNASTTDSSIIETSNGYSDWLYLNGDTSTSTPGRQVDLTVEVKIPTGTLAGSYSTIFSAFSDPSTATSTAP